MTHDAHISWRYWLVWFLVFALLSAVWPRDAVFDIAHYHIHNGWSAAHGRLGQDLAPADLHSFLNPIHSLLVWGIIDRVPGPIAVALLSPIQAAILPLLYALGARCASRLNVSLPRSVLAISAATGFLAVANLFTFASIGNDHWGAAAFIAALVLCLDRRGVDRSWRNMALASFLIGAATGMKLTNAVYIPGFASLALILATSWPARIRVALVGAAFGLFGLLLLGGWWAHEMWTQFGNPVYPHLNALFGSPELGPEEPFRDQRYLPGSFFELLIRPFQFSFNTALIFEFALIDLRFLLIYAGMLPLLAWLAWRGLQRQPIAAGARTVLAMSSAVLVTYFSWAAVFSILRYASALWLIAPILFMVLFAWALPKFTEHRQFRAMALILCGALIISTSAAPNRRIPWASWSEPYVWTQLPDGVDIADSVIVFSAHYPTAFTAPAFAEAAWLTHADSHAWSAPALANYRPLIDVRLQQTQAPVFAVLFADTALNAADLQRLARSLGLRAQADECRPMRTGFDIREEHWVLCALQRVAPE